MYELLYDVEIDGPILYNSARVFRVLRVRVMVRVMLLGYARFLSLLLEVTFSRFS